MRFFMLRSFDHAAYYETRLVLMLAAIGVAAYFAARQKDYRYAVMFASGLVFQALLEYELQGRAMRGSGYHLSLFGLAVPAWLGPPLQGALEGGVLSLMGFWFVALRTDRASAAQRRARWRSYALVCGLIVVLACIVGFAAAGREISSPRPMFTAFSTLRIVGCIAVSLALAWSAGGLASLGYFYLGLVIYVLLTFEPLHLLGARYIACETAPGRFVPAPPAEQAGLMLVSLVWEIAGAKVYYFAVPLALGLLRLAPLREATR
jgi:hypothetical protein